MNSNQINGKSFEEAEANPTVEKIISEINVLSAEEKIQIVERILKSTGLSVVLSNNPINQNYGVQINTMSLSELGSLTEALADRIRNINIPQNVPKP